MAEAGAQRPLEDGEMLAERFEELRCVRCSMRGGREGGEGAGPVDGRREGRCEERGEERRHGCRMT